MASRAGLSGLAVAEIVTGVVLAWSGIENAPLAAVAQSIIRGRKPAAGPPGPPSSPSSLPSSANPYPGPLEGGSIASAAADAMRYEGDGYTWGGPARGQSDCSGLANKVYGLDLGLAIPGYPPAAFIGDTHGPATVQWLAWPGCRTIGHDGNVAQAGDLAVWQTHMGICLGPNSMISAQDPANGVRVSGINGFIPEILFIRRYTAAAASSVPTG